MIIISVLDLFGVYEVVECLDLSNEASGVKETIAGSYLFYNNVYLLLLCTYNKNVNTEKQLPLDNPSPDLSWASRTPPRQIQSWPR